MDPLNVAQYCTELSALVPWSATPFEDPVVPDMPRRESVFPVHPECNRRIYLWSVGGGAAACFGACAYRRVQGG